MLALPIIVITGQGDETSAAQALKLGAADYLVKQDDLLLRLPVAIENAWYRSQLERERGALRESEERFRQMAESIGDVFWLGDPKRRRALYVSPAFERIWGIPVSAVYSNVRAWLRNVHEDDRDALRARMDDPTLTDFEIAFRVCPPGAEIRHVEMRVYVVRDGADQYIRRAGVVQDVTERKRQEARIEHLAYHDPLTGLPNRTMLMGPPCARVGARPAHAPADRRPVHRPRPVQARQRHAGPRGRRRAAAGSRAPIARCVARRGHGRSGRG